MPERLPTSEHYQSPREKIEAMRADFDILLEMILEELQVWNFRLATAYAEDAETGENTTSQLLAQAENELDEMWPYHDDWIMVSGLWDINRPVMNRDGVINNESCDEAVFTPAISNGFIADLRRNSAPVMGLSFKIGSLYISNKSLRGPVHALAFATPEKATFSLARKASEFESKDEQLIEAVHYYDGLLKLYTQSRSSNFYLKSAKAQQQFFDSLINDLTDIITAPPHETLFRHAKVPYIYRRGTTVTPDGSGLTLEYIEAPDEHILLSGTIKGVTILDTLYGIDTPLRSEADLIDPEAGICFIVSLNEGSLDSNFVDDRDFIIPNRHIQDLDITIK